MTRRVWNVMDDTTLIYQGKLHGYAHTARHQLQCTPSAARSRMRRLRRKSPDQVARIEQEALAKGRLA